MKKNSDQIKAREEFVKKCIGSDKGKAIKFLKDKIKQLEKSNYTGDTIKILSDLLFLSEQTIFKDFYKD